MTVQEIRAAVEAGKVAAAARIDREMGAGTFQRVLANRDPEANRRGLNAICKAIRAEAA